MLLVARQQGAQGVDMLLLQLRLRAEPLLEVLKARQVAVADDQLAGRPLDGLVLDHAQEGLRAARRHRQAGILQEAHQGVVDRHVLRSGDGGNVTDPAEGAVEGPPVDDVRQAEGAERVAAAEASGLPRLVVVSLQTHLAVLGGHGYLGKGTASGGEGRRGRRG